MANDPTPADERCAWSAGAIAALALGEALAADEQTRLLEHLLLCADCRRRLEAYAAVAQLLPLAAPLAEPSAGLRERLLEAAARSQPPAQQPQAQPRPERRTPAPWAGWRRAVGLAAALALAALLAVGLGQRATINRLEAEAAAQQARSAGNLALLLAAFGNDDALELDLEPAGDAAEAWGRVFVSPGEPALAIYARGLPALPQGRQYQVWIAHDGRITRAGSISANDEGRAWRPLRPAETLGSVERVFVTAEPTGEPAQPTGAEVLSGAP